MVGNDHLVHALEVVDADQLEGRHLQVGFFGNLAGDTFFRCFARLHEARDQRKTPPRPSRIAGQQNLVTHLHNACQNGRRVVPVGEVASGATQAHCLAPVFHLREPGQRLGTHRAKTVFSHDNNSNQAGKTPVDK